MQNQIHSKILFQNLFWAKHMKATGFISIWERLFTGKSRVNCHCLEKGCNSLASLGECDTWSLTTSLLKYFGHQTTFPLLLVVVVVLNFTSLFFDVFSLKISVSISTLWRNNLFAWDQMSLQHSSNWNVAQILNLKPNTKNNINPLSWFLAMFWPGPANEPSTRLKLRFWSNLEFTTNIKTNIKPI